MGGEGGVYIILLECPRNTGIPLVLPGRPRGGCTSGIPVIFRNSYRVGGMRYAITRYCLNHSYEKGGIAEFCVRSFLGDVNAKWRKNMQRFG